MLILCEKPSVARDFAGALGAAGKKGFYENLKDKITITYCIGHLFELCSPDDYDSKYKTWSLENLPVIPQTFRYRMNASTAEQAKVVLSLLKQHSNDEVLIATDAGREGELIARIALLQAGIRDTSRFRRFWVSQALTVDVIRDGIKSSVPLSQFDAIAAQGFARQKADWLVGMNLSRYMSIGNPPPAFSVGRVQTAVLSCIACRNAEVKNFTAVSYKELKAAISSGDVSISALLENPESGKTSFFKNDEGYLLAAAENCKGKTIDSVEVQAKEKRKKPEKLLNITGLQKAAFKQFGYKPEETLALAQTLYETHKCLSYPRTPSRVMGDDNVDLFRQKFDLLRESSELSRFCDTALISAGNKHIFNSAQLEDHHALIPLAAIPQQATEKERNVYNIVLKSFFGVCMPDFIYNEKSLRFCIGDYIFTTKIKEIIQSGWHEVLANSDSDYEDEGQEVPPFDEQNCSVAGFQILEKKTSAKKEFAIDTLLAFMEHPRGEGESKLAGLGTPATRAEIIKTLFARGYLIEEKKKLYAGERGRFLLQQLSKHEELKKMADVAQTTEWEEKLTSDPKAFGQEPSACF